MSNINATTTATTNTVQDMAKSQRTSGGNTLGKNEFLQILVAQMANQDPLSPASDTEFIAQLAQFSALEQMQQLNATMASGQAYNLVGKYAYASTIIDGKTVFEEGIVDGVINSGGISYIVIKDKKFVLSDIVGVSDTSEQGTAVTVHADMLGKSVTAIIEETVKEDGEDAVVEKKITGVAKSIFIKDGIVMVSVESEGGVITDVPISTITQMGIAGVQGEEALRAAELSAYANAQSQYGLNNDEVTEEQAL